MLLHRCTICNKVYYYYNEICENPDYDAISARFTGHGGDKGKWQHPVNGICLVCADPYQEEIEGADISYFLDLCPDCMRTIINTAYNNGHSIDGLHSYEGYMKAQQSLKDGTVYPDIKEVFEGKIKEPSQDLDRSVKHILFKSLYNEGRKTVKDDFSSPKNQMICEREKQMNCERYTALWNVVFTAGLIHEFEEWSKIREQNSDITTENLPVDPILQKIGSLVNKESPKWNGTATQLAEVLGIDKAPCALTRYLNANISRLLEEYSIEYQVSRTELKREIKLKFKASLTNKK